MSSLKQAEGFCTTFLPTLTWWLPHQCTQTGTGACGVMLSWRHGLLEQPPASEPQWTESLKLHTATRPIISRFRRGPYVLKGVSSISGNRTANTAETDSLLKDPWSWRTMTLHKSYVPYIHQRTNHIVRRIKYLHVKSFMLPLWRSMPLVHWDCISPHLLLFMLPTRCSTQNPGG